MYMREKLKNFDFKCFFPAPKTRSLLGVTSTPEMALTHSLLLGTGEDGDGDDDGYMQCNGIFCKWIDHFPGATEGRT